MRLTPTLHDQVMVVTLEGDHLDATESKEFKEKIKAIIKEYHAKKLFLDFHHVNFIDSSGLGSLLSILKVLNSEGGNVKIACMTRQVRSVFELICMHKLIETFNSVEEGVSSF